MKSWVVLFCLPWILGAAAPAPLITGAVRDQHGEPIAGATVAAGDARTTTAADGTFALEGQARSVRITCAYCAPVLAAVEPGGIVVAIVQRYRALSQSAPSAADLQSLPYAHAESAIALAPFVVLNNSAKTLPGPRLSYYGASRFGGLLVADGIPAYDIAAGASAFATLPAYGVLDTALRDSSDAFRYGDMAGGGTFFTGTRAGAGASAATAGGNSRALTFSQSATAGAYAASLSADGDESRNRAEVWLQGAMANGTFGAQMLAVRDDAQGEAGDSAVSEMTALRAHYERVQAQRFYADAVLDRAGYDAVTTLEYPVEGQWSDAGFETGFSPAAGDGAFITAGVRSSSGYYDARASGAPRVAGTAIQMHVSAGAQGQSGALSWRAGIGAFDFSYDGGTSGRAQPMFAQNLEPSVSLVYAASPQWSLTLQSDSSFRLPALTEAYVFAPPSQDLEYDRYATQLAAISYSDLRRVHVSFVALHRNVAGLDNGPVSAAGASVAWQISPALSLRAWTLRTDDASLPSRRIFRFGAQPPAATPASLWLTYESAQGLRLDAIWRRDLLDYRPDPHLDASVSGPLIGALRWFAGSERRAGTRYISAGLRYSQF
jgi:hypothetical protein